jgi:sulfur carrier protein
MLTVNGKDMEWHEGMTISEVIDRLDPSIPMVFVRVDGKIISRKEYESFRLEDESRVDVVTVISGG